MIFLLVSIGGQLRAATQFWHRRERRLPQRAPSGPLHAIPSPQPFGIQVQTINPGAYLTGFNEAMAENAFRWLDDAVNFTKHDMMRGMANGLIGNERGRLDPSDMIAKMVEVIPASRGKFRNTHPEIVEDSLKSHQAEMFHREI